jgi:hypothetical protein
MKRGLLMIFGIALMMSGGVAQDKPAGALNSDFVIVAKELDKAACTKLGLKPTDFKAKEGAISRIEVIATLDLLFDKYQSKFRVTPRPNDVYPEVIDQFNRDQATRDSLRKLSRWGVISPVSRLVANKGTGIAEEDLGDVLGYFYAQVMIYCHQPDPKWTPALQGGE